MLMNETLAKIKKLDLSEYPIKEIEDYFSKPGMGKLAIMLTDLNEKKEIERAVNNSKSEPEFTTVSRLSFKPSKFNTTFQRASTPKSTMFYGSVVLQNIDRKLSDEEKEHLRIVGFTEVSTLSRSDEILEGRSRITYGKWELKETISLASIIDPSKEYDKPSAQQLKNNYINYLKKCPIDVANNTKEWLSFLSDEFSKKVAQGNNHEYLISAMFTELFIKHTDFDGVIYPSVQAEGYGLCVAIKPESVSKLKLTKVLQCSIEKTQSADGENHFFIDNEKKCLVKNGADEFDLIPIVK